MENKYGNKEINITDNLYFKININLNVQLFFWKNPKTMDEIYICSKSENIALAIALSLDSYYYE